MLFFIPFRRIGSERPQSPTDFSSKSIGLGGEAVRGVYGKIESLLRRGLSAPVHGGFDAAAPAWGANGEVPAAALRAAAAGFRVAPRGWEDRNGGNEGCFGNGGARGGGWCVRRHLVERALALAWERPTCVCERPRHLVNSGPPKSRLTRAGPRKKVSREAPPDLLFGV